MSSKGCFLFSISFKLLLLLLGIRGIKPSHWSFGSKPFFPFFFFFCLSGAQRDSIRTSLTLSRGQSLVRAGGFTTSLSHAKKRRKKNLKSPNKTHGAFPHIISCALCKSNPLLIKGPSLFESVTDSHDGTIMIFWQVGTCLILLSSCSLSQSWKPPVARPTVFLMQFYAS